ncbi:MAG: hypothetical protein AABZ47_04650 [Planctomycetota bacterium]
MLGFRNRIAAPSVKKVTVAIILSVGLAAAALVPMTIQDFHLSGTQVGDMPEGSILTSGNCAMCHGNYDPVNEPHRNWSGSLMGQAGRDPLFYAQMTTANQDVANVGYFCMRCHVPLSFVTGHAYQPDGSTLDETDQDGVTCNFCHAMVDPIYKPGISPVEDMPILNALTGIPQYYGNSMFVLDPNGVRRGPYSDATTAPHDTIASPFHRTGDMCGTCHDVGNVAVTKQPNGTFRYNNLNEATPTEDPWEQFPLERTYTEWKLSAFANGGVDMGGRFGGQMTVVSTCQDCHMPQVTAQACFFGPTRTDMKRHEFAGASAWVLEIIGRYYEKDPNVDQAALLEGRAKAVSMLERAASLELEQDCGGVRVRVINESGHKIPTGHIEGRRIWTNVRVYDGGDQLVREYGHYDSTTAHLDEESTDIYEMHVGLSDFASQITGYPAGVTTHMALADSIIKDTRIPPRGFNNANYEAGGAPAVGALYADGQHWDDTNFWIPEDAARVEVTVNYQTVTRHYIEALRDGNVTDGWGDALYQLWLDTNKGAPIPMISDALALNPFVRGDTDANALIELTDYAKYVQCETGPGNSLADGCECMDFNGDNRVDMRDFLGFQITFTGQ